MTNHPGEMLVLPNGGAVDPRCAIDILKGEENPEENPLVDIFNRTVIATISEYADYDKQQGEAIDHSIKTGEPLFPTK